MAIILCIDCSADIASVILSNNEEIICEEKSVNQKDQASFLQPAIQRICSITGIDLPEIDSFSVVNGPGSYTGLRVALSSVKALCYTLQKPLILLNTLDVMALALKFQLTEKFHETLFCPMIDARRMEVYTALYNFNLELISNYSAVILDASFLKEQEQHHTVVAGGNGSEKLKKVTDDGNIVYINPLITNLPAGILSHKKFALNDFSDLVYSEPYYIKPVYLKK